MSVSEKEATIYELTLDALIARLKGEDTNAADINAGRAFIKDHGIEGGSTMKDKEKSLGESFKPPQFTVYGEEIDEPTTGTDG